MGKGASSRPVEDATLPRRWKPRGRWPEFFRYVDAVLLPILALNGLHLVLQAQFQLLQTDLFQLLVFAEVTFLGECIEALRVLRVLLSQSAEFLMIGQKLVFRSQHPADLQPGYMRSG